GRIVATVPGKTLAGGEEASNEPLLRTVQVESLNLSFPLLRLESGGRQPLDAAVRISPAGARVTHPDLTLRALTGSAALKGGSSSVDLPEVQLPNSQLALKGWAVLDSAARPGFSGDVQVTRLSTSDLTALADRMPPGWQIHGSI